MNRAYEPCAHCGKPILEYGSPGSGAYVHDDTDARTCSPPTETPNPEWNGTYTYAEPVK